jgi:imidazolonepropionase-like amidohydrolase
MMKAITLVAFLATLLPLAPARAQDALRYTVLMAGRPAGSQVVTRRGDGEVEATFEFNDRGRGPKIVERIRLGDGGIPTLVEISGVDYFKNRVEERFAVEAGKASWRNTAERGERAAGPAFYASLNGAPIESGLLATALLAAPGQKLALLPVGEASIRRAGEVEISAGGRKRTVVHYLVSGLGMSPSSVWLDRDGTYFGFVSSWASMVPEGWEAAIPPLLKAQEKVETARVAELARTLRRVPKGAIAFTGARLFDAKSATARPGMTVLVKGNRIAAVGPDGSVEIPEGAETIDARGKTLLPGLWDMHQHLGDTDGLLDIAAGVTSARDLGNDIDELAALRRRIDEGTAIGPRVIAAGLIDGKGPLAAPTGLLVDTPEEARAAVDRLASLGYAQVKIYSSIKPELVPVIVEAARQKGLRVSGHIPAFMTAEQAVRAGYDEIQHANMLVLNFLFERVKDTRTPERFTAVAEHAAGLDLESEQVKAFIALLRERGTVVDPTVSVFESMFTDRQGAIGESAAAYADRLPPHVRRGFLTGGLPVPDGMDARYRASFEALLRLVAALHRAGVPIVAGTDAMSGFALHRELELYVRAGIPAPEVLRIATLGAAKVAGRDKELGSIEAGKLADLVLVEGDPTARISDVRRTAMVVKDGAVHSPAEIYRALGVRP